MMGNKLGRPIRRALLTTTALASVLTVCTTAMVGVPTTQAGATTTPSCEFNGSPTLTIGGVTPGENIPISCTGLNPGDTYNTVELSLLAAAEAITDPLDAYGFIGSGEFYNPSFEFTANSNGDSPQGTSFAVPASFAANSAYEAQCPAPQSQINQGYIGCALAIIDTTVFGIAGNAVLIYSGSSGPQNPTVTLSDTTATAGQTIQISDTPGATSYWWLPSLGALAEAATDPSAATTPVPVSVTVGGVPASSNASVTPGSYNFAGYSASPATCGTSTTPSCMVPPVLSGSFVVPPGVGGVAQVQVTLDENLTGFGIAQSADTDLTLPPVPTTGSVDGAGYRMFGSDGGVFDYGDATSYGSLPGDKVGVSDIVASASTPDGKGYWLLGSDGGVFAFGDAKYYGGGSAFGLAGAAVGIASTPDGLGYWIVGASGAVLAEGDALSYGSPSSLKLNKPIVGITSTPDGLGYWLVASDGGIFAYGDATFYGSTGSLKLNKPIVGIMATPDGKGYWLVASDGGIFAYGDAAFYGSTGSIKLNKSIVAAASTPTGKGYWLFASDGGVFSYGDAQFYGSAGSLKLAAPVTS